MRARQRGWVGEHQNKSINQWHKLNPTPFMNPRKTRKHFSVAYTNKGPGAKKAHSCSQFSV